MKRLTPWCFALRSPFRSSETGAFPISVKDLKLKLARLGMNRDEGNRIAAAYQLIGRMARLAYDTLGATH